jgi:hypothetical protein
MFTHAADINGGLKIAFDRSISRFLVILFFFSFCSSGHTREALQICLGNQQRGSSQGEEKTKSSTSSVYFHFFHTPSLTLSISLSLSLTRIHTHTHTRHTRHGLLESLFSFHLLITTFPAHACIGLLYLMFSSGLALLVLHSRHTNAARGLWGFWQRCFCVSYWVYLFSKVTVLRGFSSSR